MTQMTGDPQASIDFLRWLRPGGPWVLTAIPPEGGLTETATFSEESLTKLSAFLLRHVGSRNVYFMVNPARSALTSKAKKEDVEGMAFLHVDIDPAKGADPDKERERILPILEGFNPPPSAIIDSGGGYQGFWRLDDVLHIGGDPGRIADAEAYNQQIEIVTGGDSCFNIDRIMRLPGTINIPSEKKRRAGRVERLARVVRQEAPDQAYSLAEFTAAPRVQAAGTSSTATVEISGNLPPVLIDDLPELVSQRTRMLIVQGDDPDDPTKYGSRSDVVWAVCCELVRARCPDDMIASVLLDPDYGISGHVLAQKRTREYVARQIQRAKEQVEEPMLRLMNEQHAVIADLGGKCRVISEVMDLTMERPRYRISKQSFDDFRNRYMHQRVQVGESKEGAPIYMPAGKWWLQHPMRRQYTSMIFAPGKDVPDAYNLWRGFACEAIPGQQHQLFLDHVRDNICSGNDAHFIYLVRWMARAIQNPAEAGEVAVVLRGGQGTGKGTFFQMFGSLFGRHFLHVSAAKHLVGQFNAHLRDCVFLFADEAFFAGDKQHESVLKTLVTEETLVVEGKGVDAEVAPNFTHLGMASNSQWVVPAGADERRFYVLDVGEGSKQNSAYFKKLRDVMNAGGRENLLHYLMTLDLSDYDVRRVPQTDALREQKLFSLSAEEQWWLERLMDGRTTAGSPEWTTTIQKAHLQADYLRYAESQRIMRRVSPTALGKFLGRVMPGSGDNPAEPNYPVSVQRMTDVERDDGHGHTTIVRERAYWYDLPTLKECRDEWDRRYGGPFGWPSDDVEDKPQAAPAKDDPY